MPILPLLLVFLAFPAALFAEQGPPYKLGIILPLTGEAATWGRYIKQGMDLALEDVQSAGGPQIEVSYEDDQWQVMRSVNAYHKLTSAGGVDGIVAAGSAVGNALAPLAEQAGKLFVAVGASDRALAAGKKLVVIHWVSPDTEADAMLREITRRGYRRLALVSSEHQGAIAVETALAKALAKAGREGEILLRERVLADERDFRTLIAKIRAKKCDGVVVCILPGPLAPFMRQARDLGLKSDIFAFEIFEDANEVRASDGAMVGKWYINVDEPTGEFRRRYRERFGEEPGWGSCNAYDTVRLIAAGAARFKTDNRKIADTLLTLKDYAGACGTYSSSGDNMFALPLTIKIVTADGFQKLDTTGK